MSDFSTLSALQHHTRDLQLMGDIAQDVPRFFARFNHAETATHCAAVAAKSVELAARFGCDPAKAERAGYLHDISAVIPNSQRIDFAKNQQIDVLPAEEAFPMIIHQKLSVEIARDIFGVAESEVLSAIGCHTTLQINASTLDKVIFVADKIAWDQPGAPPYLDAIQDALSVSLDAAALVYLDYLWNMRDRLRVVHPWFMAAREELLGV